jgi:hypothetical protein
VTVCDYWAPGVKVTGISELVANATVFEGEKRRTVNLRLEPIPGMEDAEDADDTTGTLAADTEVAEEVLHG